MMNLPLNDKDFLIALDQQTIHTHYVRLSSMTFDEQVVDTLEGKAASGSVQINGSSATRRTCNISMLTSTFDISNAELDWALGTKFSVEIGLENSINQIYDPIIWFPQGIFILASLSTKEDANGITVSISGKDKMCLLDGSIGGNIPADHDFGQIEIVQERDENGYIVESTLQKVPLYDIIRNAVHTYANEPYSKIFINDLDDCSVNLISFYAKNYRLLIYRQQNSNGSYTSNMTFMKREDGVKLTDGGANKIFKAFAEQNMNDGYDPVSDRLIKEGSLASTVDGVPLTLLKYAEYSESVGYELTDLTYVGDLICSAGSSITSMLDQLTKMLGEFEYFYDVYGNFHFQRKPIYINMSWTGQIDALADKYYAGGSPDIYRFNDNYLVQSFDNKPKLEAIKNDYTIWGQRVSSSGVNVPVHLRFAIDEKPKYYFSIQHQTLYYSQNFDLADVAEVDQDLVAGSVMEVDWREVLWQMAYDNLNRNDLISRALDNEDPWETDNIDEFNLVKSHRAMYQTLHYAVYYADMLEFWRKLYDPVNSDWSGNGNWDTDLIQYENDTQKINFIFPELVNFWFDFASEESLIQRFSVKQIGRRTKVIKDNSIKALFYREVPNVRFVDPSKPETNRDTDLGYEPLQLSMGISNYFRISFRGKSAEEVLNQQLYEGTYFQESITLNTVPIFYLEPNYRIAVFDPKNNIDNEYIIESMTLQLSADGMMSLTAHRINEEDTIL